MTSGLYARLRETRKDDDALAACIDRVVKQLEDTSTTGDRPGILLGKIQSGKTRAFVGVIARAFDRGVRCSRRLHQRNQDFVGSDRRSPWQRSSGVHR